MIWRLLRYERRSSTKLATCCNSLQASREHQEGGCSNSNSRVCRQHTDQATGDSHQNNCGRKRILPSEAITVMSKNQGANWPENERHSEGSQRCEKRSDWVSTCEEVHS